MRYEYIDPFVASIVKVLDNMIRCDIARGNVSLVGADRIDGSFSVIVNLKGDSKGHVVVNMDEKTALQVSRAMTGEDDIELLMPPAADSISELANMIAGNAASALNDQGFDFEVSPPYVARGDEVIRRTAGLEILQVPLFTDCGEITVNVALSAN